MSSPTRFSAKKRNARHMVKVVYVPESSSEAREAASVEAPQASAEKVDAAASPVDPLQTASEQLSSAFASFTQRKPAAQSAEKPAVKPAAQPKNSATQPAAQPARDLRLCQKKRDDRKRLYLHAKTFVWRSAIAIKQILSQNSVLLAR